MKLSITWYHIDQSTTKNSYQMNEWTKTAFSYLLNEIIYIWKKLMDMLLWKWFWWKKGNHHTIILKVSSHIKPIFFFIYATPKSKLRSKSNCKLWPQTLRLEGILILIYQMSFDIMTVCLDECYNAMKPNVRSIFPNLTILPFIEFFGGRGRYLFVKFR